jgi:NADH:ubiquinone oxidoreductase subunit H
MISQKYWFDITTIVGSLNLSEIVLAQNMFVFYPHWPGLSYFFIACLAETNRAPLRFA